MTLETELCTFKWGTGACSVSAVNFVLLLQTNVLKKTFNFQGDSGGPLVNLDRDRLLGVVSFGFVYCGGYTGFPDGFSRVSNFTTWINERIEPKPTKLIDPKSSNTVNRDLRSTRRQ